MVANVDDVTVTFVHLGRVRSGRPSCDERSTRSVVHPSNCCSRYGCAKNSRNQFDSVCGLPGRSLRSESVLQFSGLFVVVVDNAAVWPARPVERRKIAAQRERNGNYTSSSSSSSRRKMTSPSVDQVNSLRPGVASYSSVALRITAFAVKTRAKCALYSKFFSP
jgi:hypothetical protein